MAKMGWGWSEPRGWEEDPRALRAGAGVKQTSWHEPAGGVAHPGACSALGGGPPRVSVRK